ncbi:tungstate transport system substrate-binding protein [Desulfofundulus australicus DSM 11792]|jgi:tungstate transport system substrate-binding protein|uniref:Tungstate transport system substrate-binding protein n=2 Tax=Desulfofundulus TaxID=2282741 RepID=A0A1M4XEY6_9FIRM|nr:substrate-binding domain-containing protein [Desulfofundulus australicus]AEG16441.1 extracellular solute-binding protein family 1 [Desulfofundulus kuznetsovii DSM 6115]SHE91762.1 tungstate transport system substrate-binding protein [Desulfofundulus australicus DSM 11792]
MFKRILTPVLTLLLALVLIAGCSSNSAQEEAKQGQPAREKPQKQDVILATTTSTQDSGLLDVLIPEFEKKTGYKVKTIAVGTGQALEMGKKGEADVLLVHAPKAEKELVDSGVGINYRLVMHNDFIVVGPENDPAGVKSAQNTVEAFKKIAQTRSTFVSRGDESGTHKKEKDIWKEAGITPGGKWYQEAGTGMGNTLNIASEKGGYTLSDRATYLANQKHLKLKILYEGDKTLLNIYHVMQVNPEKFSKVNAEGAKAFVDFMVSPETQQIIGKFGVDKYGQPLFFPDAGKKEEELGK